MDLTTLLLFAGGLVLLLIGAELLVKGAARLAVSCGISPLAVGLTVVAFGTSSPELAVSVKACWAGQPDIALGNVVGSNIANVLLILGLSAAITPLAVRAQLVRFDVPVMIGLSVLVLVLGWNGTISRLEGFGLIGGLALYVWLTLRQGRRAAREEAQEFEQAYDGRERVRGARAMAGLALMILVGLAMLTLGSQWLVNGAVSLARWMGVSELIIGLTVVAVGTSLPEVAASVVAAMRGERDIAVGNVVGSNIFNVLTVLGATACITPAGIGVSPIALQFDIPVMIAVAAACLPIFFSGYCIARWEGFVFLGYYVAYTAYLVLAAMHHDLLATLKFAMSWFVLPLTAATFLALALQTLWARQVRGRAATAASGNG